MISVMCAYVFVALIGNQSYEFTKQIPGQVIKMTGEDGNQVWTVDFSLYFDTRFKSELVKNFRNSYNPVTKEVQESDCYVLKIPSHDEMDKYYWTE